MVSAVEKYPHDLNSKEFRDWLDALVDKINAMRGGWATYRDTRYADSDPLVVPANTRVQLTNNAGIVEQRWRHDHPFYENEKISGLLGHMYDFQAHFAITPQTNAATFVDVWVENASDPTRLHQSHIAFEKGFGADNRITYNTLLPMIDGLQTDGARVYIQTNGPCDVWDIEFDFADVYDPDE